MAEESPGGPAPRGRLSLADAPHRGPFAPVDEAVDAIREGRMVIVVDDEDRENEGDLTIAAEKTTPEMINFMAKHGRGLICLPMTGAWLDRLDVPLMVRENTSQFATAFCVSIEAKEVDEHGHLGVRSGHHRPGRRGSDHATAGSRPSRPHVSAAGAGRRGAGAGRSD